MKRKKSNSKSINNRLTQTQERVCEIEDTSFEIIQLEENKEKKEWKSEKNLKWSTKEQTCKTKKILSDTIKRTNMQIIWVPEGEEREKGAGSYLRK